MSLFIPRLIHGRQTAGESLLQLLTASLAHDVIPTALCGSLKLLPSPSSPTIPEQWHINKT